MTGAPGSDSQERAALAKALGHLGCPPAKTHEMAAQLQKRARQLASETGRPYDDALAHLLTLMRQGWAAKERLP